MIYGRGLSGLRVAFFQSSCQMYDILMVSSMTFYQLIMKAILAQISFLALCVTDTTDECRIRLFGLLIVGRGRGRGLRLVPHGLMLMK